MSLGTKSSKNKTKKSLKVKNKTSSPQKLKAKLGTIYFFLKTKKMRGKELRKLTCDEKTYSLSLKNKERKKEFILSRYCFKKTLTEHSSHSFLKHKTEEYILWPKNLTGSLSHKDGLIAFILGKNSEHLGVDLEEIKVEKKIVKRISSKEEFCYFNSLLEANRGSSTAFIWTLSFSIKESLFKCFAPIFSRKNFFLKDCEIKKINLKEQSFEATCHGPRGQKEKATGLFYILKYKKKHCGYKNLILSVCKKEEASSSSQKF